MISTIFSNVKVMKEAEIKAKRKETSTDIMDILYIQKIAMTFFGKGKFGAFQYIAWRQIKRLYSLIFQKGENKGKVVLSSYL